jgi:hypothetical protein
LALIKLGNDDDCKIGEKANFQLHIRKVADKTTAFNHIKEIRKLEIPFHNIRILKTNIGAETVSF